MIEPEQETLKGIAIDIVFPAKVSLGGYELQSFGLSKRDLFAAVALHALLQSKTYASIDLDQFPALAFDLADLMVKQSVGRTQHK